MSSFTICASWEINHPFSYCFLLFYYGLSKFSLLWNWYLEVFTKLRGFHLHSAKKRRLTNRSANRSYACWSSWLLLGREEITVSLIVARERGKWAWIGHKMDNKDNKATRKALTTESFWNLNRNVVCSKIHGSTRGKWKWKAKDLAGSSIFVSRVSLLHALFDRLKERPWKQGNQYFIG